MSQLAPATDRPEQLMEPCGIGEGPGLEPDVPIGQPGQPGQPDAAASDWRAGLASQIAEGRRILRLVEDGQSREPLTLERLLREHGPYFPGEAPTDEEIFGRLARFGAAYHRLPDRAQREHARQMWEHYLETAVVPPIPKPWRVLNEAIVAGAPGGAASGVLPAALGVRELLDAPEPEDVYIAEPLVPADANLLIGGYPKTHKTNLVLELGVSAAAGVLFLGRFMVPRRHRVGLVLMEDRAHRIRRRFQRLCQGHGVTPDDLAIRFWFRPPLRLASAAMMEQFARYVGEYELDVLVVDSWAYVASGNSDSADDVTPQLDALSRVRDAAPGLVAGLVHHARKRRGEDRDGLRLTDEIRNSSAFGAWYDSGILLSRVDERSPITIRAELRDFPSPAPFAFTVEDEHPETADTPASGWLRLRASDRSPAALELAAAVAKVRPAVIGVLGEHPGCSKRQLREMVKGKATVVDAAFDELCREGIAHYDAPERTGKQGRCRVLERGVSHRVPTASGRTQTDTVSTVSPPPLGGGTGHGQSPRETGTVSPERGARPKRAEGQPPLVPDPVRARRLEAHLREVVRGRPDLDREDLLRTVPVADQRAAGPVLDRLLAELRPDGRPEPGERAPRRMPRRRS